MCYLIAKKFDTEGCIAVKMEQGKALAALATYLTQRTLDKNIQILTVSNMDMFGEYKPYQLVTSEQDFINTVFSMIEVVNEK